MKELRVQSKKRVFRIFFVFDPQQNAILLIGGDKRGDKRFYKTMIPIADELYDKLLEKLRGKNENKRKRKNRKKDFVDELSSMLSPDGVKKARDDANKEIFLIHLAELRKKMGITQDEIKSFTQSGVSKLESRKDIKISTLLDYLDDIGLGIEIKVFPKRKAKQKHFKEKIVLLKS